MYYDRILTWKRLKYILCTSSEKWIPYDVFIFHVKILEFNVALNTDLYIYLNRKYSNSYNP